MLRDMIGNRIEGPEPRIFHVFELMGHFFVVSPVYKNEKLITSAPCSEIMGGPIHSLRWLVSFLTKKGLSLEKGSLVIPGSPVELVSIDWDRKLKVVIDNVGSLTSFFKNE